MDTAVREARTARTEGSKCRTEHGQVVCASGEVERVIVGGSEDRLTPRQCCQMAKSLG